MEPEQQFPCKVCDRGMLSPKNLFRMSGPPVVIGYILVIPSWFGMLIALLIFVGAFREYGSAVSMTAAVILGVTSFVSGLLGWLLVMKKHVLQCSVCKAVTNAS